MHESIRDRRLFERVKAQFVVTLADASGDLETVVFLVDISAGGLKIITHKRLNKNMIVSVRIKIPEMVESLIVTSRVVCVTVNKDNLYEVGLKFCTVNFKKIRMLEDILKDRTE
jgi:c-di-GMP-binding flagellar brake protein YcgR